MTAPAASSSRGRMALAVAVGAAAVALVFAIAAYSGGPDGRGEAPSTGAVTVEGAPLPPFEGGADPAVGMVAPRIEGAGFDGANVAAPAADGLPTVVLFLAHWCPACQDEVPRVQSWIEGGARPDDIALVAVSTGVASERDNYPPAVWFDREGWTVATLVDDEASQAAQAYGLPGYPYWVFLDGEGTVLGRHFGGLTTDDLEHALEQVRGLSG